MLVFIAILGLTAISLPLLLAGVDQGLFNGVLQRFATAKAGRSVRFRALQTHLLAGQPSFSIDGLVIGSPPDITHADLAHIPRITGRLDMLPLLMGKLQVRELTIVKPDLHLVRLGPSRNNFTFGGGGSSGALRHTQRLTVVEGRVHYENIERHVTMDGAFSHDGRSGLARPFELHATGVAKGQPYIVDGAGGPLNGRAPGVPYAVSAQLQDGLVRTKLFGTTKAPFDFTEFNLGFVASGPNLADYSYLLGASSPNSPPFSFTGRARRHDQVTEFTDVSGRIGRSDVRGSISAIRRPAMSKVIRATIVSRMFYLGDARALLMARPDHLLTRMQSGAVSAGSGIRFLDGRASRLASTRS